MGRPKIPRKSTSVDMTAMCDVAFLLLSFFILTTKFKPDEAVTVNTPMSVAAKPAPEKNVVLISITQDGKVFIAMDDEEKRAEVLEDLNRTKNLNWAPDQLEKLSKQPFYGIALTQLPQQLTLPHDQLTDKKLPGIPCVDSTNNDMIAWMTSVKNAYTGSVMNLVLKGDAGSKYPAFKNVMDAFKRNDLLKFQMVTNPSAVPKNSELYNLNMSGKTIDDE